jgi:Gas vesicle synthesis protein GvpO
VSGVERDSHGWRVTLEVVELRRIPESTNLLATYQVVVDEEGNLLEYNRVRRYYRNQADQDGT